MDNPSSIRQMRLPVVYMKDGTTTYHSLEDEVAVIIHEAARELWLHDIIVGIMFDSSPGEDESFRRRRTIMDFRRSSQFLEAIVIANVELSQQGVPPQEEQEPDYFRLEGTVQEIFDDDMKKYENNIRTSLHVTAYIVDIETRRVMAPFEIKVVHTGGSREKSRQKAMDQLKKNAILELKWFYWLSAEIMQIRGSFREISLGTKSGIRKDELFEIIEPDRVEDDGSIISGGKVALATVADTTTDSSVLKIVRQWRSDNPGSWAVEYPDKVYALQLNLMPPVNGNYARYGVLFNGIPLRTLGWGFGAQIIKVVDSYDDNDYGFGFGGYGIYRFLNLPQLDVGAKISADLDIPFRKDDDDRSVSTALLSTTIGVTAEYLLSANFDFVVMAGYRFGLKSDTWSYSEEEESFDAYWEGEPPEVDNSGFTISAGIRFLLR
ncbi:hypothetical protein GF337_09405 [candidate division KSB1 bacterium]|nr:hypothetical protein [candidate division KSB1 bacterium]